MSHELGARYTNPHVQSAVVSSDHAMHALISTFNNRTQLGIGLFLSVQEARAWI